MSTDVSINLIPGGNWEDTSKLWVSLGLLDYLPVVVFYSPSKTFRVKVDLAMACSVSPILKMLVTSTTLDSRKLEFHIQDWDEVTIRTLAEWLHTGDIEVIDMEYCIEIAAALDYMGADQVVLSRVCQIIIARANPEDILSFFAHMPHLLARPMVLPIVRRIEMSEDILPDATGVLAHELEIWRQTKTVLAAMFLSNFGNRLTGSGSDVLMNISDAAGWKLLIGHEMHTKNDVVQAKELAMDMVTTRTMVFTSAGTVTAMHVLHILQGIRNFVKRPFEIRPLERAMMILAVRENPSYYRGFWWPALWVKCDCVWLPFVGSFPASLPVTCLVRFLGMHADKLATLDIRDTLLKGKAVSVQPPPEKLKAMSTWIVQDGQTVKLRGNVCRSWLKGARSLAVRSQTGLIWTSRDGRGIQPGNPETAFDQDKFV